METRDFLLEIGVEEIPAGYIGAALQKLHSGFTALLSEAKLSYTHIDTFSTPRRLALVIKDLQCKQADEVIERVGPTTAMAWDAEGNLTRAAQGFLRGAGATADDIFTIASPKGEKIAVRLQRSGKETEQLIPQFVESAVAGIAFPKTMRWGELQSSFARPVRWLIVLLGDRVIPVKLFEVEASNITFGNRYVELENQTTVSSPADYCDALKRVQVIADRSQRKAAIIQQMDALFAQRQDAVISDERLLDVVVDLVESPTAVIGHFHERYLELPAKIIISTLSQHQKYFAVQDASGKLVNAFVFISNGDPACSDLIRKGNEKVITARLEDAEFYFREDTAKPLADFVPQLSDVTFQAQLGSLLEKTNRVESLVAAILDAAPSTHTSKQMREDALRAAHLCKADLVTGMLGEKEFTKLQGYMGMNYALISGETETVAQAIYEHYMPRGQNDELPSTAAGMLVAVADKLDTVCGIIGVGLVPTGSADPFALRRAANGVVQILEALPWTVDLLHLIETAFDLLQDKLQEPNFNRDVVYDFFRQRVEWLLKNDGIQYDVIASVMHMPCRDVQDMKQRGLDVQKFKQRDDFIKLVLGFKRVSNIIADVQTGEDLNTALLVDAEEQRLYRELNELQTCIQPLLKERSYEAVMEELVRFGAYIDSFFDKVLVNVDDAALRENRYALLWAIRRVFLQVADLAEIVISDQ
jgi:glycyl-tRNA synthetase beta chain